MQTCAGTDLYGLNHSGVFFVDLYIDQIIRQLRQTSADFEKLNGTKQQLMQQNGTRLVHRRRAHLLVTGSHEYYCVLSRTMSFDAFANQMGWMVRKRPTDIPAQTFVLNIGAGSDIAAPQAGPVR